MSDTNNVALGTTVTSAYTSASGAAALPGVVYTPSSYVTYLEGVGGPGGSFAEESAPISGYTIGGFQMVASEYVDQIRALWSPNYGTTTQGPAVIDGGAYGETNGTPSTLLCPDTGNSRVVGFYGYAGYSSNQYIDALGIICEAQDGSSSSLYYSQLAGGFYGYNGGSYFTLQCPSGMFVTSFGVSSGSYVDAIDWIGCQ